MVPVLPTAARIHAISRSSSADVPSALLLLPICQNNIKNATKQMVANTRRWRRGIPVEGTHMQLRLLLEFEGCRECVVEWIG